MDRSARSSELDSASRALRPQRARIRVIFMGNNPRTGPMSYHKSLTPMRPLVQILFLGLLATPSGAAHAAESPAGQPASKEGVELFEKHIRPVLAQSCYECHSAQAKKVKGKLLLDSLEGIEQEFALDLFGLR